MAGKVRLRTKNRLDQTRSIRFNTIQLAMVGWHIDFVQVFVKAKSQKTISTGFIWLTKKKSHIRNKMSPVSQAIFWHCFSQTTITGVYGCLEGGISQYDSYNTSSHSYESGEGTKIDNGNERFYKNQFFLVKASKQQQQQFFEYSKCKRNTDKKAGWTNTQQKWKALNHWFFTKETKTSKHRN